MTNLIQYPLNFQSPFSDLTKPGRQSTIAAINNQITEI